MKGTLLVGLVLLAACGGAGSSVIAPPKKPDPYITIRVRNLMDTTTAAGKAQWHIYDILTGPEVSQNGVGNQGALSLQDIRLGHTVRCVLVGADSVGQRLVSVLAVADTTTAGLTLDATAQSIVTAWFGGNQTLPAGWAANFNVPTDAWQSAQYVAGHGLVQSDPIRWGLDWMAPGVVSFYERTAADTAGGCNRWGA